VDSGNCRRSSRAERASTEQAKWPGLKPGHFCFAQARNDEVRPYGMLLMNS
jgi:hypothetical protein